MEKIAKNLQLALMCIILISTVIAVGMEINNMFLNKTVRLQILLVLSFIWTTVFSLYVFSYTTFAFGWAGLFIAHIGLIFAVYMTFKHFHRAEESSASVFKTKNFDPFKTVSYTHLTLPTT